LRISTFGPDPDVVAELDHALEHRVDVDEDVAPAGQPAAHVDARRVDERHARGHQLGRDPRPQRRLQPGELRPVVDAEHLRDRRREHRLHLDAFRHRRATTSVR
jgi:hypothetical protein